MNIPPTVIRRIKMLIPASYTEEIAAFAFTPDFPEWPEKPDLIISTKLGEVVELRDRRVIGTCSITAQSHPKEIILHYGKSFGSLPSYVVVCEQEAFILAREEAGGEMKVLKKFSDIWRLVVDDVNATGESNIRIWRHDEAIPIVLNNRSFEELLDDNIMDEETIGRDDDDRFTSLLRSKLSEVKLNTVKNQTIYEERRKFRQKISHVVSEDSRYEIDDVTLNTELNRFDKLLVGNVWQRVINGKWIIGIHVDNTTERSINNLELLLKSEDSAFTYNCKVYISDDTSPPFWLLKKQENLDSKMAASLVAVSHMPIFEQSSCVRLTAAIRYMFDEKTYCFPLPVIELKASEVINSKLDPILNADKFDHIDLLAVLCTSLTVELEIYYVSATLVKLEDILIDNLKFSECYDGVHRVLRHSLSPINILHGAVVYFTKSMNRGVDKIVVSTMTESQLLMLINLMYELIPVRCVIVPAESNVTFKKGILNNMSILTFNETEDMDVYSLEVKEKHPLSKFGSNLFQQMSEVSQYLENCMEAMSELNVNKASKKSDSMGIDIAALGNDAYEELWCKLKQFMVAQNEILNDLK